MRITKLYIKSYKNLQDFTWELNPDYPVAVIVGKNASGKSNLLEAILTIFAQVRTDKVDKKFYFEIAYQDIDRNEIVFKNDDKGFSSTKTIFKKEPESGNIISTINSIDSNSVFPKQIVSYYAGISTRMRAIIRRFRNLNPAYQDFDIIYTDPIYFVFSAVALLGSKLPRIKEDLLTKIFEIDELVEFQFKIQKPSYSLPKEASIDNFWSAPANLRAFFETLIQYGKSGKNANDYTIMLDAKALSSVMDSPIINNDERKIFEYFSETFVNEYTKATTLKIKKKGITEPLFFMDLSEGEKQRIGMRGTIELFLGSETLFLLDEPDSFAHPRWQWQFVPDLQETLGDSRSSQVIFVTHSPLVLSTVRDNAFMMEGGQIQELNDLYGMDVDTVLIDGMETSVRPPQVAEDFESYFILIESGRGETDEAQKKRQDLENIYPLNHPSFSKADMLRSLYI
jgi:AAA15 family ATPase/GTPase